MNSEKNKTVLIIGCGWIGKKLGKHFSQNGYTVFGTTRSPANFPDIENHGIRPVQFELSPGQEEIEYNLPNSDSIIISITPGRGEGRSQYPFHLERLARFLSQRNVQVIMYSSTSAYKGLKNEVSEEDAEPDLKSSNILLAGEGALRKHVPDAVILRLCGLYGEDRHPVKYLAGRKEISDGRAPVNLVHRDDVVAATELVVEQSVRGEIFNVCGDHHPEKKEIYTKIALQLGLEAPGFKEEGEDGKKVSSKKMKELGLQLQHPDPLVYDGNP